MENPSLICFPQSLNETLSCVIPRFVERLDRIWRYFWQLKTVKVCRFLPVFSDFRVLPFKNLHLLRCQWLIVPVLSQACQHILLILNQLFLLCTATLLPSRCLHRVSSFQPRTLCYLWQRCFLLTDPKYSLLLLLHLVLLLPQIFQWSCAIGK